MKKAKKLIILVLAVIMIVMVIGCAPKNETDGTTKKDTSDEAASIKFWWIAGPEHEAWMPQTIENFRTAHPNITVDFTMMNGDQIRTNIRTSLASDSGPDVSFIWGLREFLPDLVAGDLILNLDQYYIDYGWEQSITPGKDMNKVNGSNYCVPIASDANPIIYYNKEIFSKYNLTPPETEEDLKAICAVLTENGIGTIAFGVKDQWQTGNVFNAIMSRYLTPEEQDMLANAPFKGYEVKMKWDDPKVIKAMEKMREWTLEGIFTKGIEGMDYNEAQSQFFNGKVAMWSTGSWAVGAAREALGDKVDFFLFPQMDSNIKSIILGGCLDTLIVSSKTKYVDACMILVDHIVNKDSQLLYAKAGMIPSRVDMVTELEGVLDPISLKIMAYKDEAGASVRAINALYLPAQLTTFNMVKAQELMLGTKTPEQAAKEFNDLVDELRK